tara:strand:- start:96 stop:380 length:285 start_codon:yes stop_codon:yes gene_type:complete
MHRHHTNLSIWDEELKVHPEMQIGSILKYKKIIGKDKNGKFIWKEFSTDIYDISQECIQYSIDELLDKADEYEKVFIEKFVKNEDGSFNVYLGS